MGGQYKRKSNVGVGAGVAYDGIHGKRAKDGRIGDMVMRVCELDRGPVGFENGLRSIAREQGSVGSGGADRSHHRDPRKVWRG